MAASEDKGKYRDNGAGVYYKQALAEPNEFVDGIHISADHADAHSFNYRREHYKRISDKREAEEYDRC